MKQFSLPRKYTAAAQIWISVALIILAAVMAFTPILTIDLSDSTAVKELNEVLEDLNDEIGAGDINIKIPEKVGVSMPKLLSSVSVLTKVVSVMSDAADDAASKNSTNANKTAEELAQEIGAISGTADNAASKKNNGANKTAEELTKVLKSEEGQETIVMIVALLMGTIDIDFDNSEAAAEDSIGAIVNSIISFFILFYLLGFVFICPIVLIIIALITLIKALKAKHDGENIAPKFGAGLISAFGFVVILAMLLAFVPNVTLGAGMVAILVFCIISTVVNVAVSRLRTYSDSDFMYVNLVQGTGLVKLIGFIVFFTSVLKTGFLRGFIDSMSTYLVKAVPQITSINATLTAAKKPTVSMDLGYVVALILLIVAASLALSVCVNLAKGISSQLGLVTKSKKKTGKLVNAPSLSTGIIALVVCIIPVVVSKLENEVYYKLENFNVVKNAEGALFTMTDDGKAALVGMFIGAVLVLAADIALKVTKKALCPDITAEQAALVLTGNAPFVGEEAPAEEAAAEEAVAEENAAEEAPAEEAPAEEAAEEETAEETAEENQPAK